MEEMPLINPFFDPEDPYYDVEETAILHDAVSAVSSEEYSEAEKNAAVVEAHIMIVRFAGQVANNTAFVLTDDRVACSLFQEAGEST